MLGNLAKFIMQRAPGMAKGALETGKNIAGRSFELAKKDPKILGMLGLGAGVVGRETAPDEDDVIKKIVDELERRQQGSMI